MMLRKICRDLRSS